jgi:putative ABC transport system substrate-binding protein
MKRRDFITLLGGAAAAWPLAARAQQRAGMPIVGYLNITTADASATTLMAFRKGLSEMGYEEGRNLTIEYRWAAMQYDRLPDLAADLIRRGVAVIATPDGLAATHAVKDATSTIPIVFSTGADPVQSGLVVSLSRPGANVTGINFMSLDLAGKQLGLLHNLVPNAARFAVLVDPNTLNVNSIVADARTAATTIGRPIEVLTAGTNREIDAAFTSLAQKRVDALLVSALPFFGVRRIQIANLAVRHLVPTIHYTREYVEGGGLMSYGPSTTDHARQVGIYVGRILKGDRPADLPVMRSAKFEFLINLQTARTLGIEVPPTLLAIADEVIE